MSDAGATYRLAVLRGAGWSVAVHNDYRLNGEAMTFWLFTHGNGRWIKGEGRTDDEALRQCVEAWHLAAPSPETGGAPTPVTPRFNQPLADFARAVDELSAAVPAAEPGKPVTCEMLPPASDRKHTYDGTCWCGETTVGTPVTTSAVEGIVRAMGRATPEKGGR